MKKELKNSKVDVVDVNQENSDVKEDSKKIVEELSNKEADNLKLSKEKKTTKEVV